MAWDDKNYFWKGNKEMIFVAFAFALSGFVIGCALTALLMR